MYTVRTLEGSLQDMLDPAFRKIQFGDSPEVVTVCTHLRALWTTLPPLGQKKLEDGETSQDTTESEVNPMKYAKSHQLRPERDGYEGLETNPNTQDLETPWRKTLAHDWNHVFYDVMNFLPEVSCSVGHFHPPSHDVLAIEFPETKPQTGSQAIGKNWVLRKKWYRNMLLIATYLHKGVVLRVTRLTDSQEEPPEKELGSFDGTNPHEIWYIRAGTEIFIHVEGDYEGGGANGLAAVMALGLVCTDSHGEKNSCEGHGDRDNGQEDGNASSS